MPRRPVPQLTQPEALYIDKGSGARFVIERKNLVWPPEYAVGHKNDHFLVDLVSDGLKDLISDDAYELQLELAISGTYLDARRILLIEQHGDMRYMGAWWWKRVLELVAPQPEIQELWDGMFDWLDDYQQGWTFEKLYPTSDLTDASNFDLKPAKA